MELNLEEEFRNIAEMKNRLKRYFDNRMGDNDSDGTRAIRCAEVYGQLTALQLELIKKQRQTGRNPE